MKGAMAGAVLAGGASRRMGTDKALLRLDGRLLWERQLSVLAHAGAAPVWIVRNREQVGLGESMSTIFDVHPGNGPLGGVHAALRIAGARFVAVLAVDMPAVNAEFFAWLQEHCSDEMGAVVQHAGGYEPLAAIYPSAAADCAERRLAEGERSMQRFVSELIERQKMNVVALPETKRWRVANWNAPADMQRI